MVQSALGINCTALWAFTSNGNTCTKSICLLKRGCNVVVFLIQNGSENES